jgi:hypothetical protein
MMNRTAGRAWHDRFWRHGAGGELERVKDDDVRWGRACAGGGVVQMEPMGKEEGSTAH